MPWPGGKEGVVPVDKSLPLGKNDKTESTTLELNSLHNFRVLWGREAVPSCLITGPGTNWAGR